MSMSLSFYSIQPRIPSFVLVSVFSTPVLGLLGESPQTGSWVPPEVLRSLSSLCTCWPSLPTLLPCWQFPVLITPQPVAQRVCFLLHGEHWSHRYTFSNSYTYVSYLHLHLFLLAFLPILPWEVLSLHTDPSFSPLRPLQDHHSRVLCWHLPCSLLYLSFFFLFLPFTCSIDLMFK